MYLAVVLLQTLILPAVASIIHLTSNGGDVLVVLGMYWAFFGVGTRLTGAGLSQLVNPARTAQGILGIADRGANQVVHELGFANLSMGVVALVSAFVGGWAILGALAGAIYLGLAGIRHMTKRGKNRDETVATWTDLLVFVMVALGAIGTF
jgi:hypothetical protein